MKKFLYILTVVGPVVDILHTAISAIYNLIHKE